MKRKAEKKISISILGEGKHAKKNLLPAVKNSQHFCFYPSSDLFSSSGVNLNQPDLLDLDVDAVIISLPNNYHAELSAKLLTKGKHVLCEKPAALNSQESELLEQALQQSDSFFHEGFMYRFHPQTKLVSELAEKKQLGQLSRIKFVYSYTLEDLKNIRFSKELGGGVLNDVGCYGLDLADFFGGGEIQHVEGQWQLDPLQGVDIEAKASIQFKAFEMSLFVSMKGQRQNFYMLEYENAYIKVPNAFHVSPQQKTKVLYGEKGSKVPEIIEIEPANHFLLQLDYFAEQILSGASSKNRKVNTGRMLELVKESLRDVSD